MLKLIDDHVDMGMIIALVSLDTQYIWLLR